MQQLPAQGVVVFDFDHTLTAFDTGSAFFFWLLKRKLWRAPILLAITPLLLLFAIVPLTRKMPAKIAIWLVTLGYSSADVTALCREFAREKVSSGCKIFLQDGLKQVRTHLSEGHSVIIATGTLSELASALLETTDIVGITIIGSSLKRFFFGMTADEHCYGSKKIEMIRRRGFAPPWVVVYTDHHADLGLFENNQNGYLVNAKPRASADFERRFGAKPKELRWE